MHIIDIVIVCLRKKYLIMAVTLSAPVLAFLISSILPHSYYTEIRLRIDDPSSDKLSFFLNVDNLTDFFGGAPQDDSEKLYLEILRGRDNLSAAVEEFSLDTIYKKRAMNLILREFVKDITIQSTGGVIVCGYRAGDKYMASELVTFMVNRASDRFLELQKERLSMNVDFVSQKRDQLIDSLDLLNEELVAFYRENNVINIEKQVGLSLMALSKYEETISSLKIEELYAKNRVGKSAPATRELRSRLGVLEQEFRNLRGEYDESYKPSRQSVLLNTDWAFEKLVGEKYLINRITIMKNFLTTISKELALSETQLSKNIPVIQVVQDAYIPDWKAGPKRIVWIFVAFSLSFMGIISYVLFGAFLSGELATADDANRRKFKALIENLRK